MKRLLNIGLSTIIVLLTCACSMFQSTSKEASFSELKTYYINAPTGGADVLQMPNLRADFNQILIAKIQDNMQQKGFQRVMEQSEAQFIINPIFNEWSFNNKISTPINDTVINEIGNDSQSNNYITLELQAYLPNEKIYSWRGFSNVKITSDFINKALVENSVDWCLQSFPNSKQAVCPSDKSTCDKSPADCPASKSDKENCQKQKVADDTKAS